MWEKIKLVGGGLIGAVGGGLIGAGGVVIGIGIFVAILLLIGLLVEGGAWLSAKAYPWLQTISAITLIVLVVVLLPLSFFSRTRSFSGSGILISSYVFGLTLWVWGFLLTYVLWGGFAVILGLFLFGVGVVPIAMLATLFKGMWPTLGELVFLTVLVFGLRFTAFWLLAKATRGQMEAS